MGRVDSALRDRVIFVDGAPRSGTTWLVTLLATHPEIAGVQAESHLFDYGVDRLFDNFEHRDAKLHGLASYLDREQLVDLARELCDGVLMAMRAHVSRQRPPAFVVEKTPVGARADALDLERKRECYPDAWYLHIVREREAVTRSLMRSPLLADRSREACEALWGRVVGDIQRHLGDLPRYREVSYEELRADPAGVCRGVFEWLGVDAGDDTLAAVSTLSEERFSDVGAVPVEQTPTRTLLTGRARRAVRRLALGGTRQSNGSHVAFGFVKALRERDSEALRAMTHPLVELVHRSPAEDVRLEGDDARVALARLAEELFTRKHVSEWWASAGGGPAEWWTSVPGKPFFSMFCSALGADASRVDLAFGLTVEGGLIRRLLVVSAGPTAGRPVAGADVRG